MGKLLNVFKIDFDSNRIYGLDILRAFAILIVVLGHGGRLLSPEIEKNIFLFIPDGVSIFFVLSGFLIGRILIKILENEKPSISKLFKFWSRRWLRTLPVYYIILILLILLSYLFDKEFNIVEVKNFFIFCQNFFKSDYSFFLVSWSLSVEEWFYLLIPLFIFLAINAAKLKGPKEVVFSTIVIIIISTIAYRFYRFTTMDVSTPEIFDIMFRRPVVTRLDGIMFGVAGAYLIYYHYSLFSRNKNMLFVVGIVLHVFIKIANNLFFANAVFYFCNFSFVLEALATLLLLPFLSQLNTGKGILYKVITVVSLISYSMYLLHAEIVQNWMIRFINIPHLDKVSLLIVKYFLYWVLTILISILSYKYIEIPFMKLRKNHN